MQNWLRKMSRTTRTNMVIAVVGGIAVIIVGIVVAYTKASGYFASTEPENGTVTGAAQVVASTSASNGRAIKFGAPTTPPSTADSSCPLPAYPSPKCTGLPAGVVLKDMRSDVYGDVHLATANATYDSVHFLGNVSIDANNITIKNSVIDGLVNNWNGGNPNTYSLTDTTVGPATGCLSGSGIGSGRFTALRVYVRNTTDAFRISQDNVTIKDSYAATCLNDGDHSDGIQTDGGANTLVEHNTIDIRGSEPWTTGVVFWQDASGQSTIRNNLLIGGSYTVRLYAGPTAFTGNRVMNNAPGSYGPVNSTCSLLTWSDNYLVDIDTNYTVIKTVGPLACTGG